MKRNIHRRDFLRFSRTALSLGTVTWFAGCARTTQKQPVPLSTKAVDVELSLRATRGEVTIFEGAPTRVQTYQGDIMYGDSDVLQPIPNSYIGPIIRVQHGQTVRIHFINDIDEETIVHWHGLYIPATMDGHPRDVIAPGETYVYEFTVQNRAGTYWFHPHPHGRTGPQVYAGLAGLLLVSDEEEETLNLPAGEADIPLVIQDRLFDNDNQFVYLPNGSMDQTMGMLGEHILINGYPNFTLSVATQVYRLRLLNGSNSRIYRLAWSDGSPITVIASDGGLLERPVQRDFIMLAPGERIELWADFRKHIVGTASQLISLPFEGIEMDSGMMGGNNGHGSMMGEMTQHTPTIPNGSELTILTVRVEQTVEDHSILPAQLTPLGFDLSTNAINQQAPRTFTISMGHMKWLINGRTFEMDDIAQDEIVQLGTTEIWEFSNQEDAQGRIDMMGMAHPIHIHGVHFQIIERIPPTNAILKANWEAIQTGYINEGWKDTFLLMPGERVNILLHFTDYDGVYLYHCHTLEHGDGGMMRNYRVQA
ncbi:MAG: bilirubin oxidase [Chloroflexi bacterium AL-W]|nr:bilirubin oxidase [Chloroflexi bacterium AL-N1]NOK70885.1 bilirubin oxidase [Chloroflexi bacterium AL-N10]NOK78554.1 bilirubin oxidase [Chloroflexi bacterium AL-N5]NOK85786.1 bilirubin oxidase [Chloroflexi bacterium AL-W]NOK92702.1 bilirubin oxidase [Chloroflexi bacterium AL-N15]